MEEGTSDFTEQHGGQLGRQRKDKVENEEEKKEDPLDETIEVEDEDAGHLVESALIKAEAHRIQNAGRWATGSFGISKETSLRDLKRLDGQRVVVQKKRNANCSSDQRQLQEFLEPNLWPRTGGGLAQY